MTLLLRETRARSQDFWDCICVGSIDGQVIVVLE